MTTASKASSKPVVCVYGSSTTAAHDPLYAQAERLGRMLAHGGADVACGGYGGVMEAVSAGARQGHGAALGYTIAEWDARQDGEFSRNANRFLSVHRPCADLYERLRCLIETGDALIALGGGIGTLAEVALAWNQVYVQAIGERPLILVGPQWRQAIDALSDLLELSDAHLKLVTFCPTVDDAAAFLQHRGIIQ